MRGVDKKKKDTEKHLTYSIYLYHFTQLWSDAVPALNSNYEPKHQQQWTDSLVGPPTSSCVWEVLTGFLQPRHFLCFYCYWLCIYHWSLYLPLLTWRWGFKKLRKNFKYGRCVVLRHLVVVSICIPSLLNQWHSQTQCLPLNVQSVVG